MPCPQEDPNSPCAQGGFTIQSDDGWVLAALMLFAFGTVIFGYIANYAEEKGTWDLGVLFPQR